MLIPRFTLRSLLLTTAGLAVFAWVVSQAVHGENWAVAICIAAAGIPTMFMLYAGVFLLAYVIARTMSPVRREGDTANPFASAGLPPQLVPPRAPE